MVTIWTRAEGGIKSQIQPQKEDNSVHKTTYVQLGYTHSNEHGVQGCRGK